MEQTERRDYLLRYLLDEQPRYRGMEIPSDTRAQKQLLLGLLNVRMPGRIGDEFLQIQDEYLQEETRVKGITRMEDLTPIEPGSTT